MEIDRNKKLIINLIRQALQEKNNDYKLEITDHIVLKLGSGANNIPDNQVLDSTVSATHHYTVSNQYKLSNI